MRDDVFVLIGKEVAEDSEIPKAMIPLLKEFSDVFPDELPDGQVEELVSKGHVRERMSPCAQPHGPRDLMSLYVSGSVPNKVHDFVEGLPYHGDSSDDDLVKNLRTNFVYPWENDAGPSNLFADDAYSNDEPDPSRQNLREDDRHWESGMRVNIPKFDGNTLNPKRFIDWLVTIEEVFEFKEVPEKKRVPLIATKLRGRASAWWQQLNLTREKVGKSRVADWVKMKKLLRENFIPHNYQRLMYQRLQNLKQGGASGSGNATS
nr:reverse transcriptase domain-containing protein [Tanacetum cinerariifolium]